MPTRERESCQAIIPLASITVVVSGNAKEKAMSPLFLPGEFESRTESPPSLSPEMEACSPSPSWYRGRAAIQTVLTTQAFAPLAHNRWYFSPTRANGCPAFAVYHATGLGSTFQAFGIQIIDLDDSASGLLIADVTTFLDSSLLPFFGFPPELSR